METKDGINFVARFACDDGAAWRLRFHADNVALATDHARYLATLKSDTHGKPVVLTTLRRLTKDEQADGTQAGIFETI